RQLLGLAGGVAHGDHHPAGGPRDVLDLGGHAVASHHGSVGSIDLQQAVPVADQDDVAPLPQSGALAAVRPEAQAPHLVAGDGRDQPFVAELDVRSRRPALGPLRLLLAGRTGRVVRLFARLIARLFARLAAGLVARLVFRPTTQ